VALQLELMAANEIPQAVVFWGRASDNAAILAAARAHPDKFIPFVSVSPEAREYRDLWRREDPQLLELLESALRDGAFRGIGEISVTHFPSPGFPEADFDPSGALMTGIMRLAQRHRLPVLIHCEITRLAGFEALLQAHRDVQVIWAHGGYTPYFLARRLLERHPNLHYELSARTWRRHPRSPEYTIFMTDAQVWPQWRALIEAMPSRFNVGTDASQRTRASDQERIDSVRRLLAQLSEPARAAVARQNLLRLVVKRE
jgi:predicted TIM-barrel fold metal-dependent hydrolase